MVHDINLLGNLTLNILCVSFTVFHSRHMIFARTGKVVIERNDRMSIFHKPLAQMRTDEARAAGNEDGLLCRRILHMATIPYSRHKKKRPVAGR